MKYHKKLSLLSWIFYLSILVVLAVLVASAESYPEVLYAVIGALDFYCCPTTANKLSSSSSVPSSIDDVGSAGSESIGGGTMSMSLNLIKINSYDFESEYEKLELNKSIGTLNI